MATAARTTTRRIDFQRAEAPIRAELFSVERLEQHAETLAAAQRVTTRPGRDVALLKRLRDNSKVLTSTYSAIVEASHARRPLTPAAEWLLDNFHIVEEQIREIREDLPPGFYRNLPKLADGPLQGYPRVVGIAWALVAHTDSAFETAKLVRFVAAYQRVQPLTIGELWALAITLRITLVENLRRLAETIGARMVARQNADDLADRLLGTTSVTAKPMAALQADLERAPWSTAFAVQLALRLRDRDPEATPVLEWLDNRLAAEGLSGDEILRDEVQRQSSANVTVRNIITSMRLVSRVNWAEFFESVSPVDAIMRKGSNFAAMDFPTRDYYRRSIEKLALRSKRTESEVAALAVAAAERAKARLVAHPDDALALRATDPGYYLIAQGRRAFEVELGCRVPLKTRIYRLNADMGVLSYVGMIAIVTAIVLAGAGLVADQSGAGGWPLALLVLAGLVPASDVAVSLVNRIITQRVGAVRLPALEFAKGVPDEFRTMVVVPVLLTSIASVEQQIERLEVHHLSSPGDDLTFALLSDWTDADAETTPADAPLLAAAASGIARLNARHGPVARYPRFVLLHRKRLWNPGEARWIGWERKRGKLEELNRLLRGATDTTFMAIDGQPAQLPPNVRFVITLDADTRLPIGAARHLIGKLAHPLNRPVFDARTGLVVAGHGILQPRVTPSLPIGAQGSLFERVFSGPNGLDPYALAVSDVYQDLFEQGSYSGKGIYDVDTFIAALDGRIPENAVLSHDLLEGIFARAGLATDVEVVEEFPSDYDVAAARQHRWARGDWQLLPWIFGLRRASAAGGHRDSVPLMGRWKLLDNLRRSLSAPTALLALILAWLQPPPVAQIWTLFIVATIMLPPILPALASLVPHRFGASLRNHFRGVADDLALGLTQSLFLLTFLAHQAWLMVDAVLRTLLRLVTRRRLLEWVTSAQSVTAFRGDRRSLVVQIVASAAFAGAVALAMVLARAHNWALAAPFAVVWVFSPLIARWASRPPREPGFLRISDGDATALRLIARRTWRFFEDYVGVGDNCLPPDNFQEDPEPVVAHRTSPTNIGLYLLSVVTARDFRWLGSIDAMERLKGTMATLGRLELCHGHLFNWYDTQSLAVLSPKYVSSVDSGNLAGHLIALANACEQLVAAPVIEPGWSMGVLDNVDVLREAMAQQATTDGGVEAALASVAALLDTEPTAPAAIAQRLAALAHAAATLVENARGAGGEAGAVLGWALAVEACITSQRRDLERLAPWAGLIAEMVPDSIPPALREGMPTLATIPTCCDAALAVLEGRGGCEPLREALTQSADASRQLAARLQALSAEAMAFFHAMDFGFLYDAERQLLSIGYRSEDDTHDSDFYDLLASEARLASFIAIAKGDIPAKHWFRLGRTMTPIDTSSGLISWSGSMFEYLMPSLVMRAAAGSLLEQTNRLIVWRQIQYGAEFDVPWGISESQYNARDLNSNYQYSSFGVPDLGYKRGLGDTMVIAPYATGLAAMVSPTAALKNFRRMAALGAQGAYGWYEAIDFTPARLREGSKYTVIKAYMAHHQAMTLVGIANALTGGRMRARFHAEPIIQAAELLLQERMPRDTALARPQSEQAAAVEDVGRAVDPTRRYTSIHSPVPRVQILSNGRYSTMVTTAGSGYSRWGEVAVTRWREDVTCDGWGSYIFLRDVRSGASWSAAYQPSGIEPDDYRVSFSEDRAEIVRRDGTLSSGLDIMVSPEDDADVRRLSITNNGTRTREIDVTSYSELALARPADDLAHPVFAKLFVQTHFVPELGALLATRRQRSTADPLVWAAHLAVVEGDWSNDVQYETDRAQFLGRGRTIRTAAGIVDGWPLSNTSGTVLDPIFSMRRRVRIAPGATARIAFWTVVAETREAVIDLADKHRDATAFDRARALAWTQAQMQMRHIGISPDEAHLFQRLAGQILYSSPALRPPGDVIKAGLRKVSTLWAQGISGDRPIVLVRVGSEDDLELVRQMLRGLEYWHLKRLAVDLVVLNERATSYVQDLQNALEAMVRMHQSLSGMARDPSLGTAFVLRSDIVGAEVSGLLNAAARLVLDGDRGTLAEQLNRSREVVVAALPLPWRVLPPAETEAPLPRPDLEYFNGLGGFGAGGREYVTILEGNQRTPAPWINVIANPDFGFQVSTDGSGFTWSVNSQQNQLSPWSNDPVSDGPGEVLYITDEDTGRVWGPTALPIREPASAYTVSHGQGYSRFAHTAHGIALELTQFVPVDDPIKIMRLSIADQSGRARRLSVTAYVEWVLGSSRSAAAPYVVTERDPLTGAIFAQNIWHDRFGQRVAFADLCGRQTAWTCDRREFLGRDGSVDRPLGLAPGAQLSGSTGAGLDPCAALQTRVALGPGGRTEITFLLGQTADHAAASALVAKYRAADLDAVFAAVTGQWDETLGKVEVRTPDRALDIMLNRWLPYQTLACRVWARAGFYQASGAYGFRDQLQDVMALCLLRPELAREHLLRAAGRQFVEGDVQHWWLPESGSGIRTRITDDRNWLAYVVAHYVEVTGDRAVLDEMVPFLDGPVLAPDQHDAFFEPGVSPQSATLFDHCALALDASRGIGAHGLPLMGSGDWNDGMDRVGGGGQGESIWLGWFQHRAMTSFATLAEAYGRPERAIVWREHCARLQRALEAGGWDGDWYRRAYYDDGEPLGSVSNSQCRIDSIAQTWATISGAADPNRAVRALAAVEKYLIRRDDKLSLLFTPPFDSPGHDPGYIKGYPPGLRENGGQYTHAAVWAVLAFAMQGDGDKAGELLAMLNPINHANTSAGMHRYKVEPYVACADIYSEQPNVGRGGWTWYTGSAGWTYRVALEAVLGLQVKGGALCIDPCIPRGWPGFEMMWRHGATRYEISVLNPLGVCRGVLSASLDGLPIPKAALLCIPLVDDGLPHRVEVVLG